VTPRTRPKLLVRLELLYVHEHRYIDTHMQLAFAACYLQHCVE
jgi:hypothetical protein